MSYIQQTSGRVPFNAGTPFVTVHDHIYSPLPLPSDINPKIDPTFERLLLKTLAKDPNDRYPTAGDLLQALETTLNPQPGIAAPVAPSKKKRDANRWWVWVAATTLVAGLVGVLLAGVIFVRARNRQPPPQTNVTPTGQEADPATDRSGGASEEAKQAIDTAFAFEPDSTEAHLANAFYLNDQERRLAALQELRKLSGRDRLHRSSENAPASYSTRWKFNNGRLPTEVTSSGQTPHFRTPQRGVPDKVNPRQTGSEYVVIPQPTGANPFQKMAGQLEDRRGGRRARFGQTNCGTAVDSKVEPGVVWYGVTAFQLKKFFDLLGFNTARQRGLVDNDQDPICVKI